MLLEASVSYTHLFFWLTALTQSFTNHYQYRAAAIGKTFSHLCQRHSHHAFIMAADVLYTDDGC